MRTGVLKDENGVSSRIKDSYTAAGCIHNVKYGVTTPTAISDYSASIQSATEYIQRWNLDFNASAGWVSFKD